MNTSGFFLRMWTGERHSRPLSAEPLMSSTRSSRPHRAEAIAGYRTIRGRVIGSDEAPRDGVTLWALDEFDLKGGYGETAPDGTFSIGLTRDGSYRVEVYVVDATGLCNLAGWYAEGAGFTPSAGEAAYLLVEDGQVTVPDIRLPAEATPRPFAGRCVQ